VSIEEEKTEESSFLVDYMVVTILNIEKLSQNRKQME